MTQENSTAPPFRRQFFELLSGSTLAQIFSLLLMPVISRIYSPADMGEYALYVAISSIFGMLASGRLDIAVVLADSEAEGSHLVYLGTLSAMVGGALAFCGLSLSGYDLLFASMTAMSVSAIGGYQCLVNWHSRKRNYRILASRSAGEKLIVLILGIGLGWWGYTRGGLIVAQTLGLIFSLIYLVLVSRLPNWRNDFSVWLHTLRKFSDFVSKNTSSSILMALSIFLPSVLFAAFFDRTQLGHYNLASRLFDVPINLIGYTFSTVYYQYSSKALPSERLRLFWQTLRLLSFVFVPAFALASLFGPELFGIVFGDVWRQAGEVARWMAPVTALRLLYVSQASLLLVGRKLKLDLLLSALLFTAQIGGFFIGYWYFRSIVGSVFVMSSLGVLVYGCGLCFIHRTLRDQLIEPV